MGLDSSLLGQALVLAYPKARRLWRLAWTLGLGFFTEAGILQPVTFNESDATRSPGFEGARC